MKPAPPDLHPAHGCHSKLAIVQKIELQHIPHVAEAMMFPPPYVYPGDKSDKGFLLPKPMSAGRSA